jgi:hypothetical protein
MQPRYSVPEVLYAYKPTVAVATSPKYDKTVGERLKVITVVTAVG